VLVLPLVKGCIIFGCEVPWKEKGKGIGSAEGEQHVVKELKSI
jgi:hypothetical protein